MELPKRKPTRLSEYDYTTAGAYFVTICTKEHKEILSKIYVGGDAHIVPRNILTDIGKVCEKYLNNINLKYEGVVVDKYVIMPNHIHMILSLGGTMKASSPTNGTGSIIRSFKTMVTKEIGCSIWQRSYNDHIIRGKDDYNNIWEYIDTNVQRWAIKNSSE